VSGGDGAREREREREREKERKQAGECVEESKSEKARE